MQALILSTSEKPMNYTHKMALAGLMATTTRPVPAGKIFVSAHVRKQVRAEEVVPDRFPDEVATLSVNRRGETSLAARWWPRSAAARRPSRSRCLPLAIPYGGHQQWLGIYLDDAKLHLGLRPLEGVSGRRQKAEDDC
jgi:hypothetical protein